MEMQDRFPYNNALNHFMHIPECAKVQKLENKLTRCQDEDWGFSYSC